jgi:hypothetical protein
MRETLQTNQFTFSRTVSTTDSHTLQGMSEKRITGRLVYEGATIGEAGMAAADFAGRYRALGWDVDDVQVEIVAQDSSHHPEDSNKPDR